MRKQITYIVEDNNRDHGKEFIITEMSAWDADELSQEIFRIMGSGMPNGMENIPDDVVMMGCAGLATYGLLVLSSASPEVAKVLRSRLLATVEIAISHEGNQQTRKVIAEDFEEVTTIRSLMDQVFKVNFDFLSIAAA
ncbi:hypothetical protein [Edwardsiella tarda]|uniref:hypothetical protein n=1 Tax=Edwardsiella tarda TaxID=636 RepID=UPI0002E347E9|nr:hypothetical protein [Edwardsiella tarda]